MKVLLIGRDGRAYSIAGNLYKHGHKVVVAGRRDFMPSFFDRVFDIEPDDGNALLRLAREFDPDLIVSAMGRSGQVGVLDMLREYGFRVFGESHKGAMLEMNKIVGLETAKQHGIPIAPFKVTVSLEEVKEAALDPEYRVVKRIGLSGGRGVKILETEEGTIAEALAVIEKDGIAMVQRRIVGVPLNIVWIQTPSGPVELCLQTDYKRTYSGDLGPFCGAMGATVWNSVPKRIVDELISPISPYLISIQYFGRIGLDCMYELATGKFYAIEWTTRFGVPTTETMLWTWDDDFAKLCLGWLDGDRTKPKLRGKFGVGVILAGGGYPYPDAVMQGVPVTVTGDLDNVIPMGVSGRGGSLKTKGGRHFVAVGYGDSVPEAQRLAYRAVKKVKFADMIYRIDIGNDVLFESVFEHVERCWT